ncbi:MAG TPA: SDR family oxidoreductase [Acidimicrobiales bacterium]|nr:SDR family oxidoreductase [Acidimicrobiales bacterium]
MAVAVITGGSRGFGLALARGLAERGWKLVLDARGADELGAAARDLAATTEVVAVPGDVGDEAHRQAVVEAAEHLGGLDLLVNNASALGPSPQPTLDRYPLDVLARVYAVNVVAPLGLVQLALPLLRASHGRIVNVTSDAAVEGYEGWGGYGSSKAALEQLSKVLAAEEPAVRVWWLDPGDMRTRMQQEAFPGEDISDRPPPEDSVPAVLRLLDEDLPSGRYRARDLLLAVGVGA